MPIVKKKVSKKAPKALVVKSKPKVKKPKNTPEYYQCLSTQTAQGIKGTNIAKVCSDCKQQSKVLVNQRKKELKKWMVAYKQLGVSLGKLLKY